MRPGMRLLKALSLEGEGWVRVYGVEDGAGTSSPLTPTLSPQGRGRFGDCSGRAENY
jgi:hypothetical protein